MKLDELAAALLERLRREDWIALSRRGKRLADDLADWLAQLAAGDVEAGDLGEWLVDHDGVEDVFATDEQLAAALAEVLANASQSEPDRAEQDPEPPDPIDAILEKIVRPFYRPITTAGDGAPTDTKFGGTAYIPAGDAWPCCGRCAAELPLFAQLDLAALPAELGHPHREGLVQLFYCTTECEVECQAWGPGARSVVARWLVPRGPSNVHRPPASDSARSFGFQVNRLASWQPQPAEFAAYGEELPITEDERELVDERYEELRDSELRCHLGDKLGGWPRWIQDPSYPKCPLCRTAMRYLLQLDSNGLCGHQFGDLGAGHLFQCAQHPEQVAFTWACH